MALDLYFLRHGETEYNAAKNRVGGRSNHLELSQRGDLQAKSLGRRLKTEGIVFNEIYSSTAVRAKRTAEIVAEVIGYPLNRIIQVPELLELSNGEWEGKLVSDVRTPAILEDMNRLHWEFKAPNGESQKEVEERKYSWLRNNLLVPSRDNQTIGLFGHGLAIKCLLRGILNSRPNLTYRISIENCSITRLKYSFAGQHEGWSILKINDHAHLLETGHSPTEFI